MKAGDTILRLAVAQHGVIARGQLVCAGVAADVTDRRVRAGRLRPLCSGVFLVEPLRDGLTREMAAVLACGPAAMVSHWSAAIVWQVISQPRASSVVDVSAYRGGPRQRPGLRVHRTRSLRPEEMTTFDALPITTVERTLLDLASVAGRRDMERALTRALNRELTNRDLLVSLLANHPRHPGTARFRAGIEHLAGASATRSEAEARFLALVRKAQLPAPAVNVRIGSFEVDFLWPAERFAVEIDGFAYHSFRPMFESDRRRDAALAAAGVQVTRITWRQLVREPEALLVRLAQALLRNGPC